MIFDCVTCYKLHILEYGRDMGSCGIKKKEKMKIQNIKMSLTMLKTRIIFLCMIQSITTT